MNFHLLRGSYVPERYGCSFWQENTRPWDSGPCAYQILCEAKFGYTRVFDLKPCVRSYRCLAAVQHWQSIWPAASGRYKNGEIGVCQLHDGHAWVTKNYFVLCSIACHPPHRRDLRLCPFLHRCSILLNLSFSLLPGEALPKPVIPQNAHSMQNTHAVLFSLVLR